jgi:hypothetical protein
LAIISKKHEQSYNDGLSSRSTGEIIQITGKGGGTGKYNTIQGDKRHETFSFEYILRSSAKTTQQHNNNITTT